ncbi:hypothetical protein ACHAWU_003358 [Discostella pseudostelligera]|uniref:Uncharacterized protein n=1 Tax=Discostella pseudostelligera TaxID=259834 RepID=A0ABD3MK49_9STRA
MVGSLRTGDNPIYWDAYSNCVLVFTITVGVWLASTILARYEVSSNEAAALNTRDNKDDGSPYDWTDVDKDGFASDLRQLVIDHFSKLAKENGTISSAIICARKVDFPTRNPNPRMAIDRQLLA